MAQRGAPKGSQNRLGKPGKKTLEVIELLNSLDCNPIEGMVRIAKMAEEGMESKLKALCEGIDIEPKHIYADLSLAGQMYKELAQYVAPKRKAIEHTGEGGGPVRVLGKIELVAPKLE